MSNHWRIAIWCKAFQLAVRVAIFSMSCQILFKPWLISISFSKFQFQRGAIWTNGHLIVLRFTLLVHASIPWSVDQFWNYSKMLALYVIHIMKRNFRITQIFISELDNWIIVSFAIGKNKEFVVYEINFKELSFCSRKLRLFGVIIIQMFCNIYLHMIMRML